MAPAADRWAPLLPANADGVGQLARFFRALSDPTRLRLLEYLLEEEHTVTECIRHVGLSQSRVSTHLTFLADCGYIQTRREGRFTHYRVIDRRVADLVALARLVAADNASALAGCMRIDSPVHDAPPSGTRD